MSLFADFPSACCPVCRARFTQRLAAVEAAPTGGDLAICPQCSSVLLVADPARPSPTAREDLERLAAAERARVEEARRRVLGVPKARAAAAGGSGC